MSNGNGSAGLWAPLAGAVCVVLFLLPGVALSRCTRPRSAAERLATSVILSSLVGYLCFWVYLGSTVAGRLVTVGILLASVVAVARAGRRDRATVFCPPFLRIVFIQIAVVVVYASALNLVPYEGERWELANEHFFPQWRDNNFQDAVAARLFTGEPVAEINWWSLTERPPLQAGLILMSGVPSLDSTLWLQAMSTAINASWLIALAYLAAMAGLGSRALGRTLLLCVFVGFFYNSTVFVWPKMLAGTLVVLGAAYWWYAGTDERMAGRLWLGIVAWGTAWFAHPSTGFALVLAAACGIVVGRRMIRRAAPYRVWTIAVLTLSLAWLILPWTVYKQLQEHPSDGLLQYHLGGVFKADPTESGGVLRTDPAEPALDAILSSYTSRSLAEIGERKLNNLRALFLPLGDYGDGPIAWRRRDYYQLFFAFGILHVGWLVWLGRRWFGRRADKKAGAWNPASLAAAGIGAFLVLGPWILIEFGPSRAEMTAWVQQSFNPPIAVTILHQGTYAPYLLLVFVVAALTARLRGWSWRLVLTLHLAVFGWFYVLTPRGLVVDGNVDPWAATLFVLGLVALFAACLRTGSRAEGATDTADERG